MQNSREEKQGNKRWEGRVSGERYHIMWKIALSVMKKVIRSKKTTGRMKKTATDEVKESSSQTANETA